MTLANLPEAAKHAADKATVSSLAAAWVVDHTGLFTGIAAILTVIWFAIRIWESDTIRDLTGRKLTGKRDDG